MAKNIQKQLYSFLKDAKIVDEKRLSAVYEKTKDEGETAFISSLVALELVSAENVGKILADFYDVTYINLRNTALNPEVVRTIPEIVSKKQQVILFQKEPDSVSIATVDPNNAQIKDFLHKKTGLPVKVFFTTPVDIVHAQKVYAQDIKQSFDELIQENVVAAQKKSGSEPPISKIVDTIIKYAYQNLASDIHIEQLEESLLVRFRIDGVLHDVVTLPAKLGDQIVTRIRVLAKLRTDVHQEPQDGKLVYKTDDEDLDLRVSVVPTTKGEKVVMRLLSERSRQFSLVDLGFSSQDLAKVEEAYKSPHGMILATGPTGSGKTTTLYAILKLINSRDRNIMTIEDPVEYDMENINQIQVNASTDLTFAKGLRSIVRQDPDVILVGEIRDQETAGIAVNSAMTGHLVLSTLHTNDAVTSFPRLIDMDVEPYLISSTVSVVIAQRLVRRICRSCRVSTEITYDKLDAEIQKHVPEGKSLRAYHGKGCSVCHETGYTGRIGIFEVLTMTDALREAVELKKGIDELSEIARANGMRSMLDDGIEKVTQGHTTLEEVLRVTKD